jgi:hypothetical protein
VPENRWKYFSSIWTRRDLLGGFKLASTGTKVVLGIGCGLLAVIGVSLATCVGCATMLHHSGQPPSSESEPHPPPIPAVDASFKRIGGQGMMDFVVISKDLSSDRAGLERRVRNFCDLRPGPTWCGVLIWLKPSMAPKKLPMSAKQSRAQFASYIRNPNTGHDCFQLLRNGDEVWHTGRCE